MTSSSRYPNGNGMAKRSVQTIKKLLTKADKKNEDPYLAILAHRSCPDPSGDPSPAEKLMARKLLTRLPLVRPQQEHHSRIELRNMKKQKQVFYYNQHAKELPTLENGSTVRIYQHCDPSTKANWSTKATVIRNHHTPRSYIVKTEEGQTLRSNRRDLMKTK